MTLESHNLVISLGLFLGMIACSELGRRLARMRAAHDSEGPWQGVGVVDGAMFGLLGLLVAFTFSGASSRFDARRNLIVQETNAIGTAYLRLDLLPADRQPALRESFRGYLDARIGIFESFPDLVAVQRQLEKARSIEPAIWSQSLSAASGSQAATMLLLPAVNEMFDLANTRTLAMMMHPPSIIYVLLFGLALASATLAGYGMAKSKFRNWFHIAGFAAVTAGAFYVIVDLEYPRLGAIQIDAMDSALRDLRKSMN